MNDPTIDQTQRQAAEAALAQLLPPGWDFQVSIWHARSLVLTVEAAPEDLLALLPRPDGSPRTHADLPEFYLEGVFKDRPDLLRLFRACYEVLKAPPPHYAHIKIGRERQPFLKKPS